MARAGSKKTVTEQRKAGKADRAKPARSVNRNAKGQVQDSTKDPVKEQVLAEAASGAPIDEEELRSIVARLARGGNMPACRFYCERWIAPAGGEAPSGDPTEAASILAAMDELAARRAAH